MINYLKDIKKETLIGQLPDVINSNNESIRKEFNWIFDSSLNRLTKSVYAPTGSVKAHFGEFTNLACEYFTVKNTDSLKPSIQSAVESIIANSFDSSTKQLTNHNILNHRFANSEFEESNYMHDADSIIYEINDGNYTTVKDVLDTIATIDTSIQEAYDLAKNCGASLNELSNNIESVEQLLETTNSSVNTNKNDIQELNSAIDELSEDAEAITQLLETANSSIRKINNSINNLSNAITDLEERNSNNVILSDIHNEIVIAKNQYNFIATPISDNDAPVEIKFGDDINHEYNFKFILDAGVEKVYIRIDKWYIPGNDTTLYINCDNNTYYIDYSESDNVFTLTQDSVRNSVMYDITLNRYINDKNGTTVCMLYCKVYKQHIPL